MSEVNYAPVWPDTLRLRDTGLYDDLGGCGQRIYTTAGAGYEKREYVRADLAAAAPDLLEALKTCLLIVEHLAAESAPTTIAEARAAIAKATGQ
jgi:hypothetical protein